MNEDPAAQGFPEVLLNRFRVEAMLGQGGLGVVVRAFDMHLKRVCAIKMLRHSLATDPGRLQDFEERFAREAEAGSRMGIHPNLVVVLDSVTDAGNMRYLIMEYVAGGALAERLKQGPLSLRDALRVTADAARGLQAAHDVGIVHRDIKPGNIFLTTDGRAKVGDFGVAQIGDLSVRPRDAAGHPGTPLYFSPEQARTTDYLRPASDQYSLGLVLFEMVTGRMYKRLSEAEATRLMIALPPPVRTMIERMLEEQPGARYSSLGTVSEVAETIRSSGQFSTNPPPGEYAAAPQPRAAPPPHDALTRPETRSTAQPEPVDQRFADTVAPQTLPSGSGHEQTPRVNLQPIAPPSAPAAGDIRHRRRTVLIGLGGLVVAGTAGGGFLALNNPFGSQTATPARASVAPATTVAPSPARTPAPGVASPPAATPSPTPPRPATSTTAAAPPATATAASPATSTPTASPNPDFAILAAGTTNEDREPRFAGDSVPLFHLSRNERVYGWVQVGRAPVNETLQITVIVNGVARQQQQSVTLVKPEGFQVFPLDPGAFPIGSHRMAVSYRDKLRQVADFTVVA